MSREPFARCVVPPFPSLKIEFLTEELISAEPGLLERIAKWFWDEWTELYHAAKIHTHEELLADIRTSFLHHPKRFPCLMLAREGKELLGTVGLEKRDILPPNYRPRPPWMTCVFVAPAGRGRGIGRYLTQCAIAEATAQGFPHLWLWTEPKNFEMYKRYGWVEKEYIDNYGHHCVVMLRKLKSPKLAKL